MNIYAEKGDKVVYLNDNGYDSDREYANKHLIEGETYTVDKTIVHSWSSEVVLEEVPGGLFNTVMFRDLEGDEDYDN